MQEALCESSVNMHFCKRLCLKWLDATNQKLESYTLLLLYGRITFISTQNRSIAAQIRIKKPHGKSHESIKMHEIKIK
jgi:hypothetical protein